jgi:hypothetical protein
MSKIWVDKFNCRKPRKIAQARLVELAASPLPLARLRHA